VPVNCSYNRKIRKSDKIVLFTKTHKFKITTREHQHTEKPGCINLNIWGLNRHRTVFFEDLTIQVTPNSLFSSGKTVRWIRPASEKYGVIFKSCLYHKGDFYLKTLRVTTGCYSDYEPEKTAFANYTVECFKYIGPRPKFTVNKPKVDKYYKWLNAYLWKPTTEDEFNEYSKEGELCILNIRGFILWEVRRYF